MYERFNRTLLNMLGSLKSHQTGKLTEFFNDLAFKVGALVGVNPLRYTIMYYEVIKESFICCFSKLILGWDGLGISSVIFATRPILLARNVQRYRVLD
jgi:hypothetical protein